LDHGKTVSYQKQERHKRRNRCPQGKEIGEKETKESKDIQNSKSKTAKGSSGNRGKRPSERAQKEVTWDRRERRSKGKRTTKGRERKSHVLSTPHYEPKKGGVKETSSKRGGGEPLIDVKKLGGETKTGDRSALSTSKNLSSVEGNHHRFQD